MLLASFVAGVVVAGMAVTAAVSRDSSRRRSEWRAQAAEVRERNRRRALGRADRFDGPDVPGPRRSPEDTGRWLVRR